MLLISDFIRKYTAKSKIKEIIKIFEVLLTSKFPKNFTILQKVLDNDSLMYKRKSAIGVNLVKLSMELIAPRYIIIGINGKTKILTTGATREKVPNEIKVIGVVPIIAARLADKLSLIISGK